jgi:hypothetical protein
MPRGRHRHSPPLHRLLPPSAVAGVSLVCAFGPWFLTQTAALRVLAAVAAATAVAGGVVMRRWDIQAGRQVADLTRARAGDEWRFEERVAELETDLDESRELRTKLEQRLRAKRAELAGLRNEHASLLRRYATAETERASALEGRRLLEIEAAAPSRALPPGASPAGPEDAATPESAEAADTAAGAGSDTGEASADGEAAARPAVFSPAGLDLYRRAGLALARLDGDHDGASAEPAGTDTARPHGAAATEAAAEDEAKGQPQAVDVHTRATAVIPEQGRNGSAIPAAVTEPVETDETDGFEETGGSDRSDGVSPSAPPVPSGTRASGTHASARPASAPATGHFTVPTAVAVVAPAPARRVSEGSFDFFGTQAEAAADALDAVHDEDLADVVGQEALAERDAVRTVPARSSREQEAVRAVPADTDSSPDSNPDADAGSGEETADSVDGLVPDGEHAPASRVIDLTAHDETEHIDVQRLRSAAS